MDAESPTRSPMTRQQTPMWKCYLLPVLAPEPTELTPTTSSTWRRLTKCCLGRSGLLRSRGPVRSAKLHLRESLAFRSPPWATRRGVQYRGICICTLVKECDREDREQQ